MLILWLAKEQFPNKEEELPDELLKLKDFGLAIKWCNDIRSYKKLIPALKEFPDDIVITFDDDVYYPFDTVEKLYNSYLEYPKCIHANRVRRFFIKNNEIMSKTAADIYWVKFNDCSFLNKITGCGGVLYPPHSLCDKVLNEEEFERIKKAANKIQSDSDVLVVIGIGGSYLGARAVIEAVTNCFNNMLPAKKRKMPMIVYAGNNLSSNYLTDLLNLIGERDISINVISKSGTTTEPAIAFRVLREAIETKYGVEEAKKRIYVTTDKKRGALKGLADQEGYETFVIPDNVGGRFSVLTAVGLLPIATAGVDIDKLMQGARDARAKYMDPSVKFNDCYKYAVVRNLIYNSGKKLKS